jgi:hypothetical protein
MGEMDLRSCLVEAVKNIRSNAEQDDIIEEEGDLTDLVSTYPRFKGGDELTYFLGYLQGMADGFDVTVLELLDEHNVPLVGDKTNA